MKCKDLFDTGKLEEIKNRLSEKLRSCTLCPRNCKVDRVSDQHGYCCTGRLAKVSSHYLHFGEEPELVGRSGSGTIFFAHCNLGCCYCQNHELSHFGQGLLYNAQELSGMMLELQAAGAENINFVSPTHVLFQIVEALSIAIPSGLNLPLVYNCGGYEKSDTLKIVEGAFDIYMPDIKYADNAVAKRFSQADDYWEVVQAAVIEMNRQVGRLIVNGGKAEKGLMIRHLVLPENLAGTGQVLRFIKDQVSAQTYVNIMDQYFPSFRAYEHKELSRRIMLREYQEALDCARTLQIPVTHESFTCGPFIQIK